MDWTYTLKRYSFLLSPLPSFPSSPSLISTFTLLLPSSHHNLFISASLLPLCHPPCDPFVAHTVAWTWHRWLGCGARGRSCPVSTRSCSETCRMSLTRPGTWPSTATSWAARACSHPSSRSSQWSRRTSPSYMKVDGCVESPEFFLRVLATYMCQLSINFKTPKITFLKLDMSFRTD